MSADYKPGTVAVATVCGEPNVRVAYADPSDVSMPWFVLTGKNAGDWAPMGKVVNIRPLVVLDLDHYDGERAVTYLRNLARESKDISGHSPSPRGKLANLIADQIEAQTKPPRIPEPGLWGVVEANVRSIPRRRWVHHEEARWISDTGVIAEWDDLVDPVLVRDGIEEQS
jgi:hypothetical protein